MTTTIQIPDFDFSAFFYTDVLEALVNFKRINVPELTDESEFEPYIQALRAFALVCHLNNVNIDVVANESTLPTAQLTEVVRNMLRLIDYELAAASPAQADILYELSGPLTAEREVVSLRARCASEGADPISYEANEAITAGPTNVLTHVWGDDGGTFTDFTASANSATTPGDDWTPWSSPEVGDAVYFGHEDVLFNQLTLSFTSAMSGISGVWEFYDGNYDKANPDSVTQIGSTLQFVVDGYLGSVNRAGTQIRVKLNDTGTFADGVVTWTGSSNVVTVGLLGQSSPSTDILDYTVGSDWEEIDGTTDGTANLTTDGDLEYTVPQSLTQNWVAGVVNGATAYYIRYRITEVTAPVSPVIQQARIDLGLQYVLGLVTQGRTQVESPLGSSTGLPTQSFSTSQPNFIDASAVLTVDGTEWTEVENFLDSGPTDEHYLVTLSDDDTAVVEFGDGVLGRIPPIGVGNIAITYRNNAHLNGNLGANAISVDKAGLNYVERLHNPRQASGWEEAQGASESSLERAKILGPQSLRDKDVALGTTGLITLTKRFTDASGARPYSRAQAFEEGFGEKTVELVVVTKGGAAASTAQLEALELFFNGDKFATPPVDSAFISNQEVVAVNYQQRVINIVANVTGDVTPEEVVNQLTNVVQPEALKDDGVTFEWNFGGEVPRARIIHEIFNTDRTITDVELVQPAADVVLSQRQLPIIGSVTINVL